MSNLAPVQPPKPLETAPQHRISGKVRTAIEAMVWQGLNRQQAAEVAGLKDNSLYVAFRKPDVKAYYLRECEVLRTSHRSRAIHRLQQIGDAADNMPAVQALKTLHPELGMADDAARHASEPTSPWVTIRIIPQAAPASAPSNIIDVAASPASPAPAFGAASFDSPPLLPVPFPGPIIGEPPPKPDARGPMGLYPKPLRRRW